MKFVIVGLGSIGKRHQKNLELLGHQVISAHHQDNLEQIIDKQKPDGLLVCTPTRHHLLPTKTALAANLPVFIEKPLSNNLEGVNELKGKILVGYCLRFDQSLRQFKAKIDKLKPEQIKSVKIVCQSWLPDCHPGTDYTQSYSAKKELGGGVLLDLSHEIDYALWFFGSVKKVTAKVEKSPELNIETEATADLNLDFESGIKANIYLSYASRKKERYCEVITDSGALRWDFQSNNDMYIAEMKHFVKVSEGKEEPLITVGEAKKVLEVVETAKINQS